MYNKNMCNKIIEYLRTKAERQDSLEGIILGLFPEEIDIIYEKILNNLHYLISEEILIEEKNKKGRSVYKIV